VRAELHEVAQLLHQADHLDRQVQQSLANLLEELKAAVSATALPSTELLHVAQDATQIAQHLHRQEQRGVASAREGLRRTLARVELQAPAVAGFARLLLETLANLGI
jgi:hypothetical protein